MTEKIESPVDLCIENGHLLTPARTTDCRSGIAIDDGRIVAVGETDSLPDAERTLNADGNMIAPGIVDEHVHDRSLGQTHKEDWETVTHAAAAGGVTTVLGHGNNDPYIETPQALERKIEQAKQDAIVDVGCFAWITTDNYSQIEPLIAAGAIGLQASLDERAPSHGELLTAMEQIEALDERLGIHVEHGEIVAESRQRRKSSGNDEPIDHCRGRPPIAEVVGAVTLIEMASETGCPVHVFQVSTGDSLDRLGKAKQRGLDLTIETTPHYLWFSDAEMSERGSVAVVSPPLRSEHERKRLLEEGLESGIIDCIGTDHAPHTDEEKCVSNPFGSVWDVSPGFAGVETGAPSLLTLVQRGHLTHPEWIQLHSATPAQIWGLYPQKGSLQVGTDADVVIVDPEKKWTVDRTELNSKSTATVWDGETFTGKVQTTIVRGEIVYDDGVFPVAPGYGSVLQ